MIRQASPTGGGPGCASSTRAARLGTLLALTLLAGPVRADPAGAAPASPPQAPRRWVLQLNPEEDLFPRAIADPRRPMFAVSVQSVGSRQIPDATRTRLGIRLGGRYGFIRLHPAGTPDRGFQLAAEGGFMGLFDAERSLDNIAWDGIFGLHVAWAPGPDLALRVAFLHNSSHVGDEYAERTGRERISYTREDAVLGASWRMTPRWRVYAEGAYALNLGNEAVMDRWRAEGGVEYEAPPRLWDGRMGWYAASQVSTFQEDDGEVNLSVQLGVRFQAPGSPRLFRFGIEHYRGRSVHGEFFFRREYHVGIGFWFEL